MRRENTGQRTQLDGSMAFYGEDDVVDREGKKRGKERRGEGDKIDRDGGNTESTGEFLLPLDGERESFNVWI